MQKVSNRRCIRTIASRSLKANRSRNGIAILAIVLTTVLFTSLFTIAGTIVNSFQESNFRMVGGNDHGSFKDLTWEQVEELRSDPLIVSSGARRILGMPMEIPFNKAHVEVSYMEEAYAKSAYCVPETGTYPAEGSREIACDTRILTLLGVEPEIGAELTLSYEIGGIGGNPQTVTDTFTLSGWWTYDPVTPASQAIVSQAYADEVLAGYTPASTSDQTGLWTLDVNFKNANHIEENLKTVLANHGYQCDTMDDNFIDIGVNWGYMGAQMSNNFDAATLLAAAGLLLLIAFTGYLIIYNIFQISVTNDIRFYGLLKTIGTTPRQIRRIIRMQALLLSAIGIPIGLIVGYGIGNLLAPQVMLSLSYTTAHTTANPLIFLGSAAFSLVTVLLSTRKPGKIAGRVSPVEAVRYTEGGGGKKAKKQGESGGKVWRMALANLGRSKKKTVLVVLSLALAVVLLQITYLFANGFDMDKYLRNVTTDFTIANAGYFQVGGDLFSGDMLLDEESIQTVTAQGGISEGGRIYGRTSTVYQFITEDYFRKQNSRWKTPEVLDQVLATKDRDENGKVESDAQLYGMEDFPLDQLHLLEGDLAPLHDPTQNAVAAVYFTDDYGKPHMDSHWAKLGEEITLRYVDHFAYYDTRTGEAGTPESIPQEYQSWRAAEYHDVTYTVTALITMNSAMSYRYYGEDEFILNDQVFRRDTGTDVIMSYIFNTTDEANEPMNDFLKDYTENIDPVLDFESRQSYEESFYEFRNMFLLMGGALSFVVGLVGILNFQGSTLTSILSRRREFAVLQSIGMTGRQLKTMLLWEGLYYTILSLLVALVLSLAFGLLMGDVMNSMFWFFTYRFTLLPVALVTPVFLLLGAALPLLVYRVIAKQTIVERLREAA